METVSNNKPRRKSMFAIFALVVSLLALGVASTQSTAVSSTVIGTACPIGEFLTQIGLLKNQCQSSYISNQFNSTYGLVGYWPLDEQSGTIAHDVSGNNNTGNLINSPSWAVQNCPFNSCLNYSALAHQYIKLQNTNNFPIGANSRTIVMRIYVSHKDGSNSYSLFSYGATTFSDNKVFNFNCGPSSDGCKLGFYDGNFAITTNIDLAVSSGQYMIAISTNNTSMAIYALNLLITPLTPDYIQSFTQQVKFTDSGLNTITGFGCLLCGYSYYGAFQNIQWFNGTASDIRIYNYTLSPIQLLNIFKNYPVQYPIFNIVPGTYHFQMLYGIALTSTPATTTTVTLPFAEPDTNYAVVCTGSAQLLGVLSVASKTDTTFVITYTAVVASDTADCIVTHS